jgi:hypothetical protein
VEGDPAELSGLAPTIRRALGAAVIGALVLWSLAACSDGGGEGGDEAEGRSSTTVATVAPDADEFCAQLADILGDDPFAEIFGNDDPMQAAVVFDRAQAELEALVVVAPDDISPAAERYRDTLAGFRALILPAETIDADTYQARVDELRTEQQDARQELDAHLAGGCNQE